MHNKRAGDESNSLILCLKLCCAGHFVVDFACALAVVALSFQAGLENSYYYILIVYNLVAFGSQPFFGWLVDRRATHRAGMTAGVVMTGFGALATAFSPVASVLLLGGGNALFHVGAGVLVYRAAPGKAGGPGLFVAPGGAGILAGILLGYRNVISPLWMVPLLGITAIWLHLMVPRTEISAPSRPETGSAMPWLFAALPLFLLVVGLRSFTGFALPVPWKGTGMLLMALSVFLGKASGGFLADRFGWRPLCGSMLLIAAAVGIGYQNSFYAACIALFCIQTTTGITLAGVMSLFPDRPAFAFSLPCIALLFGAVPFFLPFPMAQINSGLAAAICFLMAIAALGALTFRKHLGVI